MTVGGVILPDAGSDRVPCVGPHDSQEGSPKRSEMREQDTEAEDKEHRLHQPPEGLERTGKVAQSCQCSRRGR